MSGQASDASAPDTGDPTELAVVVVTGHGEVEVTPDALRLDLRVEVDAFGVADALAAARSTMADVRGAVAAAGVATADLQSSGLNVWQRHDKHDRPGGYTASESLSVLLRDPQMIDVVLQVAAEAAADRLRVGGFGLTVIDPAPARDEARRRALADAERVARVYAEAAGHELGALRSLTDGAIRMPRRRVMGEMVALAADAGVEPGTQTITANVTAEWALA
jgi:uncharacterized protein YggE